MLALCYWLHLQHMCRTWIFCSQCRNQPTFHRNYVRLGVSKKLGTLTQCHSVLQWKACTILIVSRTLLHRQWHMLYWLCSVHKIFSLPWPAFVNNVVGSSSCACARCSFLATAQWSCNLVKRCVHRHFLSFFSNVHPRAWCMALWSKFYFCT